MSHIVHEYLQLPGLAEDRVWREHVQAKLADLPRNVLDICKYGFTEILNNAIDHSGGQQVEILVDRTQQDVEMEIRDDGVGIFNEMMKSPEIESVDQALLELAKGRFTTDAKHHTGEGIFFCSRVFDGFWIFSGEVFSLDLTRTSAGHQSASEHGTEVHMRIAANSTKRLDEVFAKYAQSPDFQFSRTDVPVLLAQSNGERLLSRSEACRLLARLDLFKAVQLDFKGVEMVGQAFADEIFRVFAQQHPAVRLEYVNANTQVKQMIRRAIAGRATE